MKQRKRVSGREKTRGKARRAGIKVKRLEASASGGRAPRYLPEDLAGMYKPVKKPITVRLDADILAWYQRGGRGYQTRINLALRKAMMAERRQAER
jgi:uncharacterized protein (DUF4415 family)